MKISIMVMIMMIININIMINIIISIMDIVILNVKNRLGPRPSYYKVR